MRPFEELSHEPVWWSIALRGLLAVLFGLLALSAPGVAATAIVVVFAIYALADAAVAFVQAAYRGRAGLRWGWFVFEGIASAVIGVIALAYPGATFVSFVVLVAIRAFLLGGLELMWAISGKALASRWLLGLTGVMSLVFGVLLLGNPFAASFALVWAVGVYAIVFGVMLLGHGLHLYGSQHEGVHPHVPTFTAS